MATTYKYGGIKPDKDLRKGIASSRLILEGSSTNPKRSVEVGDEIELEDDEYKRLSKSYKLTTKKDGESGDDDSGDGDDKSGDAAPASGAQHASAGVEAGTAGRVKPPAKS